jgi:RNA polymerase sigma-70 factor, ECF subfamily
VVPLNPFEHGGGDRGSRFGHEGVPELVQPLDRLAQRPRRCRAGVATGEMKPHAHPSQPRQLAVDVRGEQLARLVARPNHHVHQRSHPGSIIVDAVVSRNDSDQATEPQLLERARAGDLEAFAEFVRVFERRVRAVCYRLLDDARDVDEAVQDTFVQAWRNLGRFRGEAAPATWLYRIAVNEALQRRRRKTLPTSELHETTASGGQDAYAAADARAFLIGRLRALPIEYRTAVVLRDIEGLSNEEVARVLEISLAAAKSRIHRGRMRLREDLERRDRGEGVD